MSFVFGFLRLPGLLTMHSAFSKRQLLHQSATIKNEGKKVLSKVNKENLAVYDAVQYLNIFGRVYPPYLFFLALFVTSFKGKTCC